MVPLGWPYLPTPITIRLDPVLEKVPPPKMLPLLRAPVEKLTEPKSWPGGAVIPLKPINSAPRDTIPALVTLTVPNLFVMPIPLAEAATGNSSAHRFRIANIRRMAFFFPPHQALLEVDGRTTRAGWVTIALLLQDIIPQLWTRAIDESRCQ